MGQAIGKALTKKATLAVFDHEPKLKTVAAKAGIKWLKDSKDLKSADFVIVAVKPKDVGDLAGLIKSYLNPKTILVSIAAGVTIKKLAADYNHNKIVRVMPNLGLKVGQGMAVWKFSSAIKSGNKVKTEKFLKLFTDGFEVKSEDVIDRVTAISGSGPAYFFLLGWCLEQSAKNLGFSGKEARRLVEKTFTGASQLQIGQDYGRLIERVMSKGGTTEAAFKVFKKAKLDKIVNEAVYAAYNRAKEISRGK